MTAPFDVVKTRLQSNLFSDAVKASSQSTTPKSTVARTKELLYHLVETGHILRSDCFSTRVGSLLIGNRAQGHWQE